MEKLIQLGEEYQIQKQRTLKTWEPLTQGKNSVRFPGLGTVWESSYIQKKLGRISETVIHVALKSPTFSHNICISHIRPSTDPDVVTDHR